MDLNIISQDKNEAELTIDNVTLAEVLRVYLYDAGADLAVWRREHPSKPVTFKIKSSSKPVTKVVADAVAAIKKECDAFVSAVKK